MPPPAPATSGFTRPFPRRHFPPRARAALLACALAAFPLRALAHGEAPRVYSVAATDDAGEPTLLRLTEGLALRRDGVWRYVCPIAWGDDTVAPADSIPNEPLVIAGNDGLFVLDPVALSIVRHPTAPAAEGRTLALRASDAHVVQLRVNGNVTEVLTVDATNARVIFSEDVLWDRMDVDDDDVVLARLIDDALELLQLSFDGEELARIRVPAPPRTLVVWPHILDGEIYLVAITNGGLQYELARVDAETWSTLHSGNGAIAGPALSAGGRLFFGVGGELIHLDGDRASTTGDDIPVTCLGRHGALAYACTPNGLHAIDNDGLGEMLFDFDDLMQPDPRLVPAAIAPECDLQWVRFQLDLQQAAIAAMQDAGADIDDAGSEPPDASAPRDASEPRADTGSQGDAGRKHRSSGGGCGCHLAPDRGGLNGGLVWLSLIGLMLAWRAPRRTRSRIAIV